MLAVAGGKGGCGKTTTTLGLALAAADRGRTVLAVDADVAVPDLHRVAGVDASSRSGDAPIPTASAGARGVPGVPGVDVLPAVGTSDPDDLHRRLAGASAYDRVLLDCPAGAGRDAAVPLRAADRTLLVTTDEDASLRDAAKTAAMSRAVGTPVAAVAVTRTDGVRDGVASLLDTDVVQPVPSAASPTRSSRVRRRYARLLRRLWAD